MHTSYGNLLNLLTAALSAHWETLTLNVKFPNGASYPCSALTALWARTKRERESIRVCLQGRGHVSRSPFSHARANYTSAPHPDGSIMAHIMWREGGWGGSWDVPAELMQR